MKESQGLPRALEFEHLEAPTGRMAGERCLSRKLYAIAGHVGVFRRMPRSTASLKSTRPGALLAFFDGTIVELLRDRDAERELYAAGFAARGGPDLHPLHQPPRPGADSSEAEQLRQAGLAAAEALDRVVLKGLKEHEQPGALEPAGQVPEVGPYPGSKEEPQARRYPADGDEGKTAAEILAEQGQRAP